MKEIKIQGTYSEAIVYTTYPFKLTIEEKELFDKENPYWANFFKDRTQLIVPVVPTNLTA